MSKRIKGRQKSLLFWLCGAVFIAVVSACSAADPMPAEIAAASPGPPSEAQAGITLIEFAGPTRTPFQPVTNTPTPAPTSTPIPPTLTPTPSPTPTAAFAAEAAIEGIWGFPQAYNLSCESRSASDLARYFGVNFSELDFLYNLPSSDNPDLGFVGNVQGSLGQLPPLGYGVHAEPVAALMRTYGLNAEAHRNYDFDSLRTEIAAGRPVMIWAIRELSYSDPVAYTDSNGETTVVARFEHTFIVIGYTQDYVTVLDNQFVYSASVEQFLTSWGILGNMAITVTP